MADVEQFEERTIKVNRVSKVVKVVVDSPSPH